MNEVKPLFSNIEINTRIRTVANGLKEFNMNSSDYDRMKYRLGTALQIIASNSEDFDNRCSFSAERINSGFISALNDLGGENESKNLQRLNTLTFRFISEYDISASFDLSLDLQLFLDGVLEEEKNYSENNRKAIQYVKEKLPAAILKNLLNSADFTALKEVQKITEKTIDKINNWKEELHLSERKVNSLQEILTNQSNSFNFVGLSKGFGELEKTVKCELKTFKNRLIFFGLTTLIPIVLEFTSVNAGWISLESSNNISLIVSAITSITATLLLLYFFRVTLRSADASRAQLIQIRLRMTLCQFIQNYAEYSTEIKSKNSEALSKFENLIFSGLVSSDDKLPSTFDGIDQLGGLLKAIRGEGK